MRAARMMPACIFTVLGVLACPIASATEQQASFAVTVRLHAAAKVPSAQELCAADAPLDARTLRALGVAVRVDCPKQPADAPTPNARSARGEPARPPEVMVSF